MQPRSPGWESGVGNRLLLHFELPRRAHFATEPTVGFRVAHEFFLDGIPLQLLAGAQSDGAQMAHRHRAMTDFSGANRLLAAADAVDEIPHVVIRLVEPRRIAGQRPSMFKLVNGIGHKA